MLGRGSDSFRPDSWPGCAARGCPSLPPVLPARVVRRQGGAVETRSTSRRDGSAVRQQGQVRRVRRELEGRARVPQFLSRVLRVDRPGGNCIALAAQAPERSGETRGKCPEKARSRSGHALVASWSCTGSCGLSMTTSTAEYLHLLQQPESGGDLGAVHSWDDKA